MKPRYFPIPSNKCGVLAQLVERLNGIEEVRGSNPLGSKRFSLNHLGRYRSRGNNGHNNVCRHAGLKTAADQLSMSY